MTLLLDPPRPLGPVADATRREFIVSGVAALLLAACGADRATDEVSGPASADSWSFTDDRGVSVTLPSPPTRLVMQEDAAGALLPFGLRPIGTFGNAPLPDSPQFRDLDLGGIESVGETFGEINLEKLAALKPDLIITPNYPTNVGGFKDAGQVAKAEAIAPIVAIDVTSKTYSELMGRFQDLAGALGADLSAPDITRMRQAFDEARAELKAAAEAKPGLVVMAVSPTEDLFYVANPRLDSELLEYRAAGLDIYDPGSEEGPFQEVSWELVPARHADVYLIDSRSFADFGFLADHPIWPTLPAVRAGQVGKYFVGTMYRMPFFTDRLRELAALIARSNDLVG